MKNRKQTNTAKKNDKFGILFEQELKTVKCPKCRDDLDLAMMINQPQKGEKKKEDATKAEKTITTYNVLCRRCRTTTPSVYAVPALAAKAFSELKVNK